MNMENMTQTESIPAPSIGRRFYQDVAALVMRPGGFYEALPGAKTPWDALLFLGLSAVVYSVMAMLFTPANRSLFFVLYLLNAVLMPFSIALVLHCVFRFVYPGRFTYGLLLGVTAYANVVLLFSWIPGIAPFAELLRFWFIGLGLAKTGGISGMRAFFAICATITIVVVLVYFIQFMVRF
jgi:hypothetical protein